jgi:hypothetical protein
VLENGDSRHRRARVGRSARRSGARRALAGRCEIRAERDELIRQLDALDAKAGIVLGSAGVVAALAAQHTSWERILGLFVAVLAALGALGALLPQRFPAWDVVDLQRYATAEPVFTKTTMLNTTIRMVQELKLTAESKLTRLRVAAQLLALAVVATSVGTMLG